EQRRSQSSRYSYRTSLHNKTLQVYSSRGTDNVTAGSHMTEKSSPSGKLIVGQDGPVTTITLNRPRVHNALDQEISAELNAAVKDVSVDRDCRVLILRGAGETFCAGDDIKGFLDFAPDDGPWNVRMYQEAVNITHDLVPVTLAGVDGVCTGGGLELTLVCDFVI